MQLSNKNFCTKNLNRHWFYLRWLWSIQSLSEVPYFFVILIFTVSKSNWSPLKDYLYQLRKQTSAKMCYQYWELSSLNCQMSLRLKLFPKMLLLLRRTNRLMMYLIVHRVFFVKVYYLSHQIFLLHLLWQVFWYMMGGTVYLERWRLNLNVLCTWHSGFV